MKKVYITSKLDHAERWIKLWDERPGLHITSRWIFVTGRFGKSEPQSRGARFWVDDLKDVADADMLLCYGEPGENLRGALVETGAALALGKPVLCVGDNENFGTWKYHPLVKWFRDLDVALDSLGGPLTKLPPPHWQD